MVHIDENHVARPVSGDLDFKELFQEAISVGAGLSSLKSADKTAEWTPSLLVEALAQTDPKGREVDLRTVQNWFQDNDKGISSENIVCLARVFGSGDPDAIAAWRTELRAANKRLASRRRTRRKNGGKPETFQKTTVAGSSSDRKGRAHPKRGNLAECSERVFTSSDGMGIAMVVWAGFFLLCLMSFVAENHDITYFARTGLEKQVGFFWSLSWPIECLFLYPAVFLFIANFVSFWKRQIWAVAEFSDQQSTWGELLSSMRLPFWVAAFVAFILIFVVQWGGVYLMGLTQKGAPGLVDWILVSRLRPDVVSAWEALCVSFFAFFYSGLIYWFYFTGLLLLFAASHDFCRKATSPEAELDLGLVKGAGDKLQMVVFRCTIIGILAAMVIRLNAIYLKSDGATSLGWLAGDFLAGLGYRAQSWAFLDLSSVSSLTSSMLLLMHLALFGVCTTKVRTGLQAFHNQNIGAENWIENDGSTRRRFVDNKLLKQLCLLCLLCVNFILLGRYVGFTLLLFPSLFVAVAGICWSGRGVTMHPSPAARMLGRRNS
ncbi:hypothetical protein [uncultured Sulfitobacter sp.]|uniref:hypothetical protein n=1 Tax=uncultured Sulfitobacter sp. TaxID=191468 RepID=UPI0030F584ED